jgi:SM-20-related protein
LFGRDAILAIDHRASIWTNAMLNPRLDIAELSRRFALRRRIVIRDVFEPQFADRIFQCLSQDVKWGLAYHHQDGPKVAKADELAVMPQDARAAIESGTHALARRGFSYLYASYPMLDAYLARQDPGLMLHSLFEFINSPAMLGFARAVTGMPQIVRADAQATLYAPGHFLTAHNDYDPVKGRLAAYVLGFTKSWRADYGGMLQFLTDTQDVEEGFLPHFNSLMMFSVPQNHAVTAVPAFAPTGRYSVTGWFQDATGVPQHTKAKYGL